MVGEAVPAARVSVRLLGGFRVEANGVVISPTSWRRRSASDLVKLLALEPSHRLHREQVQDLLWPELPPASADTSFRQALYAARRVLDAHVPDGQSPSVLQLQDDLVVLDATSVWIGVDHFRSLAASALRPDSSAAELEAALAAYGGELLPEDRYEEWAIGPRESLARLHIQLLERLVDALEAQGRDREAIARLEELLAIEPTREELHRRLMTLHGGAGNRTAALRQYEVCRDVLKRELDVEPDAATEALYRRMVAAEAGGSGPVQVAIRERPRGAARPEDEVRPSPQPPVPVALRRVAATPLVGREEAFKHVVDVLRGADAGTQDVALRLPSGCQNCNLILVSGEAGVGKTRLIAEVGREAHQWGAAVLWGGSYEQEGQSPYGPFIEALEGYLQSVPDDELRRLSQSYPELVGLLPSLRPLSTEPLPAASFEAGWETERSRLFAAVARFLTTLGMGRGLVLVLDDVHWADDAALQLLHYVVRGRGELGAAMRDGDTAPRGNIVLLATYREEDVGTGTELQRFLAAVGRAGFGRRVRLLRLARAESDRVVQSLLGDGMVDDAVCERIYRLSLGNPLFVVELVHMLRDSGSLSRVAGRWSLADDGPAVPDTVRALIEARVDRMPAVVRELLDLAAVAGMEFSFELVRHAAVRIDPGLNRPAIVAAFDEAVGANILEERGSGYVFRHPLWRAGLYERLSARRRALLHGSLAQSLEVIEPENVAALAFHFDRSDEPARAGNYHERAGDRARLLYANAEALEHYRSARRHLSSGRSPPGRLATVDEKIGAVLTMLARRDEARAALEDAIAGYRATGDIEGEARAVAELGRLHAFGVAPSEGAQRVEAALATVEANGTPAALAGLYVALAHVMWLRDWDRVLAVAERAVELARAAGDDRLAVEAEVWRGRALMDAVRRDEGRRVLEGAVEAADAAGYLPELAIGLAHLGIYAGVAGEFARAETLWRRATGVAERIGNPEMIVTGMSYLGLSLLQTGKWQEARDLLTRAYARAQGCAPSWLTAHGIAGLGVLHAESGDWEAATLVLNEALAASPPDGNPSAQYTVHCTLAEIDIMAGRPDAALARLERFCAAHDIGFPMPGLDAVFAHAYLELGDLERAIQYVERQSRRAHEHGNRVEYMHALRIRGMVLSRAGRWDDAESSFDEAIALARSMPFPLAEARTRHQWGLMAVNRGWPDAACRQLEEALAIFQRLGARKDVEAAQGALARLATAGDIDPRPFDATDEQWTRIAPLLPRGRASGRQRADDRAILNGILWVLGTGARWSDMPRRYGAPATAHRRYQEWLRTGLREQIEALLPAC